MDLSSVANHEEYISMIQARQVKFGPPQYFLLFLIFHCTGYQYDLYLSILYWGPVKKQWMKQFLVENRRKIDEKSIFPGQKIRIRSITERIRNPAIYLYLLFIAKGHLSTFIHLSFSKEYLYIYLSTKFFLSIYPSPKSIYL